MGCVRILRNYLGEVSKRFSFKTGPGSCFYAECWALLMGVKAAWEAGGRKFLVELTVWS